MDLDYYAWRRFARALPIVALLALWLVPGVQEWLTGVLLDRALDRAACLSEVVFTPLVQAVTQGLTDSLPAAS